MKTYPLPAVVREVVRTPARRISLALAFSFLVHIAILWLPYLHLPRNKLVLPPLTARIVSLPDAGKQPASETEPDKPVLTGSASASTKPREDLKRMRKSAMGEHPLFPRHLQLAFEAYKSGGENRPGEILHSMDIDDDRYSLKAVWQDAGLSGMQRVQASYGHIGEQGLLPDIFEDETISLNGRQGEKVTFRRSAGKLQFSQGKAETLPDDAQDALSFMYQLSQISMQQEYFPLPISDKARLGNYQVEVGVTENISTPMGELRALHLRTMHEPGEAYLEIWLGVEYRLLPVKFRRVDGVGNTVEEFAVSDIRASDK